MTIQIAPSILSADFCNLERDLKAISNADLVHVDVMDHHFVPNLTLGEPIVARICEVTDLPVDVHLMIEDPDRWAPEYAKRGVKFYLGHKVTAVNGGDVTVEKDGETSVIQGEKVLLSVGRRPVTKGFGLETLAPEPFRNGIKVNGFMQTSVPNVYACGDITAFSLLAHTAVSEAEVAVDHILGKNRSMSYKAIPGVVYTNPEIAGVGKTEEELQAEGTPYTVKKIDRKSVV